MAAGRHKRATAPPCEALIKVKVPPCCSAIVREIMMYHGASTGRFTGTGVQVHNFPRGSIKDTYTAVEIVKHGDLEACSMLYGDPMNLFSSCLRSAGNDPPIHLDIRPFGH